MLYSIRTYGIAGLLILTAGCGGTNQQPPVNPANQAVPVALTKVENTDAVYYDEYPGIVTALDQVEIRAQVTGYITGIHFKDGDKVKKGQRLYSIDQQVYTANVQQAEANLQVKETNLIRAQKDLDRYLELDKKEAIAKQQVDHAQAAFDAAQKEVEAAKAGVNVVKSNVSFSLIQAPFNGTIGISQVRLGTSVVAGQTLLNTVSTDNPIAVDFFINQNELYRFNQLQSQKGDSTFTIAFGNDVYPEKGKLNFIDRSVDPQTGSIRVRLSFDNKNNLLKPGMTTKVRILNTSSTDATLIPYKAVTEQLGSFFVYVLGDSSKVTQRKVVLGRQVGTNIIVTNGLTAGETIVTEGVQNLREGITVQEAQ